MIHGVMERVIIDGNNLLFAMHAHAPMPAVGRETLVRVVDRWAKQAGVHVTVVFDGPTPSAGLVRQMASSRVEVRFSAPETADDIIARLIKSMRNSSPPVRVISSDTALRREATRRRLGHSESPAFVAELFAKSRHPRREVPDSVDRRTNTSQAQGPDSNREKPDLGSPDDTKDWLNYLGFDTGDPPSRKH